MAISRVKKEAILEALNVYCSEAKGVVFVKNSGLTVVEIEEFRKNLRAQGARMTVAKKTLIKLALKANNLPDIDDAILEGPIGVVFGPDEISAAKLSAAFAKEHEKLELMGGILEGKVLSKAETVALSKVPSKQELYGSFVQVANAPIQKFHGVCHGLLSGLARCLQQVSEKKA